MILLLDVGNTRLKWRLQAEAPGIGGTTFQEGNLGHGELGRLTELLAAHPEIQRLIGSNVAGPAVGAEIARLAGAQRITAEWLRPSAAQCGVRNHYLRPETLGADRWAALIGARARHTGPALVVTAGTATTLDLLDGDGNFRGGAILPGVELMRQALAGNTAQLPLADGSYSETPRNTADAIHSGILHAQAGAVERMFRQIADQPAALCLLGGGAADAFSSLLQIPLRRAENLVLDGLGLIAHSGPHSNPHSGRSS
ncbi:type III pantothenate kinase [Azoarcus indigens]|uniref:Type III pantothenate kinase n=1 Tax=Azoarcus indigens TaxID=29545 RepID=A0A4R6E9F8_9RHOO|nr:type III pantothenate kinase [Azoarcus indigens]NMG64066.1 type III pantothenate kinase [Azoarcus indigens]TDN53658.1 type III pantothenate kinase [Azoarcus indigens]